MIADAPVAAELPEQLVQPPIDDPQPAVGRSSNVASPSPGPILGEEAAPDEPKSSGPLAFVFELMGELLAMVVMAGLGLLKTGIPIFTIFGLFWINLWIGVGAWTAFEEPEFGTSALIYAFVSVLLVIPLSIHRMLMSRAKQPDEGALATTLAFVGTMVGAFVFPCFVIGLGGLRRRDPNGVFSYVEVGLLSVLFLYWGHLAWWGVQGSPVLESPLLAVAAYGSPVALFLLGVWWEPLHSWYEDKIFGGAPSDLERHGAGDQTNPSRTDGDL
jgi:hypothetical protein